MKLVSIVVKLTSTTENRVCFPSSEVLTVPILVIFTRRIIKGILEHLSIPDSTNGLPQEARRYESGNGQYDGHTTVGDGRVVKDTHEDHGQDLASVVHDEDDRPVNTITTSVRVQTYGPVNMQQKE